MPDFVKEIPKKDTVWPFERQIKLVLGRSRGCNTYVSSPEFEYASTTRRMQTKRFRREEAVPVIFGLGVLRDRRSSSFAIKWRQVSFTRL